MSANRENAAASGAPLIASGKDALLSLADKCEQATGPDRVIDYQIRQAIGGLSVHGIVRVSEPRPGYAYETVHYEDGGVSQGAQASRYTASIDSALTLVPEGYSPVTVLLDAINEDCEEDWAKALPRYVCAAALRARSTGGDGDE